MAIGTNPFNRAVIFAGLGDKERALESMEHSTAAGRFVWADSSYGQN